MKKGKLKYFKKTKNIVPRFEIAESVLQSLNSYRQIKGNETGGILMGSIINDYLVRINRISMPCIEKSSSKSFERNANTANEFIKQEYEISNHTRIYIGEWHTHPENIPTPSFVDLSSIRDIFTTSDLVLNGVVFLIIGKEKEYWGYFDGRFFHQINPTIV